MTQTIDRTTPVINPAARRWVPLAAMVCTLSSPGLWAGEPKVEQTTAAEVTAATQDGNPAVPEQGMQGAPAPAPAKVLTVEQVRGAQAEAESRRQDALKPDPAAPNEDLAEKWGVEVIRIDYTADGYWLDFRFRVTDVDKALPLFDSRIKPYVESEKTGVKLAVPTAAKVGALRTTNRGQEHQAGQDLRHVFATRAPT